ncbi:hypothetical protein BDV97DRAFT_371175 [Delphinella strobiligena]|nr:hypothetical protein BDV97DRAFT_371175 [Delphinella strobiligena]
MSNENRANPFGLTPREDAVLQHSWQCMTSMPEVNMDKLLEKSDINTMKTLTNTWGVIKKKLRVVWEADANPEATVASEGDDAEPDTPKAAPQKAAVAKKGTAAVKKKGTAATKKGTAATKKGTAVAVKKRTRATEAEDDNSDDESQIRRLGRKKARKGPPRRIMLDDGSEDGDGALPDDEGEE